MLDNEQATILVDEWSEPHLNKEHPWWNTNYTRLLRILGRKCVKHAISIGGSEADLEEFYWCARNLVGEIQDLNCFSIGSYDHSDVNEDSIYESHSYNAVWERKYPNQSYHLGYESRDYFNADKGAIHSLLITYLNNEWMRHPYLDWVFMDMMITQEICAFNEEIKKNRFFDVPGGLEWVAIYFKCKGNLSELSHIYVKHSIKRFFVKLSAFLIGPLTVIYMLFYFGLNDAGIWSLIAYSGLLLLFGASKLLQLITKIMKGVGKEQKLGETALELSLSMQEVWRRLGSPIINPKRIKEARKQSEELGAVWDEASYSLLEKIIKRYETEWIIDLE